MPNKTPRVSGAAGRPVTHGLTVNRKIPSWYRIWSHMLSRCTSKRDQNWTEILKISYRVLYMRIAVLKWPHEKALSLPVMPGKHLRRRA